MHCVHIVSTFAVIFSHANLSPYSRKNPPPPPSRCFRCNEANTCTYRSISLPPPAFTHFLSWRRRDGLLSLLSPGFVSIVIIREQFFLLHRLVSFALGFCMAVASHMPAAFGPHSYLYRCFFRRTGQFLVEVFFSLAPFFFLLLLANQIKRMTYGMMKSMYWAAHQRFFRAMCIAFKVNRLCVSGVCSPAPVIICGPLWQRPFLLRC